MLMVDNFHVCLLGFIWCFMILLTDASAISLHLGYANTSRIRSSM